MRMNGIIRWTGAAAIMGMTAGLAAAQTVTLKPKYEAGKTMYIERRSTATQSMTGGPMGDMKFKMENLVGMLLKVESADANGAKLTLTYERVMSSSDAPMMAGTFDSDARNDDESPEMAEIFGPMMGGVVTAELDKDGKVKSCTGMEAVVKKMEDSAGGNQMFNQIKRNMTDDEIKRQWIEAGSNLLPDKPVKAGDTWTNTESHESGNLGKMSTTFECKLDKLGKEGSRDAAYISYTLKVAATEPKENPMGGTIKLEGGEGKGTVIFDVKTGLPISASGESSMKLKFEAKQGEQSISMDIANTSTESTVTMTEAERAKAKTENKKKAEEAAKAAAAKAEAAKSKSAEEKKPGEEKPKKDPG